MNNQELQEYYAKQSQIINEQLRLQEERRRYELLYHNYTVGAVQYSCDNEYVDEAFIYCEYFE